jgi:hypothetical protein
MMTVHWWASPSGQAVGRLLIAYSATGAPGLALNGWLGSCCPARALVPGMTLTMKFAPLSGVITLAVKHHRSPVRTRDDRNGQALASGLTACGNSAADARRREPCHDNISCRLPGPCSQS